MCRRRFGVFSVTSGASDADSRRRANKDGANDRKNGMACGTRNSDTADAKPNGGMAYSSRNSGTADASPNGANRDGSTRSAGMAGTHASGASKAGAGNRSATIPWLRQGIAYQRR